MSYPVVVQPQMFQTSQPTSSEWNSSYCDCCADTCTCLCGTFVPCILACKVASAFDECCCLPVLCGTTIALRTGIRERYHIKGSICDDCVKLTFCAQCTLCQMYRELKERE
ncbi:cornifelin homolog B-like [Pelobates fuscus]|uniref:cornifelin homolog B-like n=1 Tax=Pelobates fuscus TaxID=191477 RepID=UPI002FE4A271